MGKRAMYDGPPRYRQTDMREWLTRLDHAMSFDDFDDFAHPT